MKPNFHVQQFVELSSTNDYVKSQINTLADYSVIVASKQTQGRGRFDRVWESNEDLTFTMLFKTEDAHSLLAPVAIIEALRAFDIEAYIKWPNDILVNGKKIAGILIEKVYDGNVKVCDIVGIGMNLSKPAKALSNKATYIEADSTLLLQKIIHCYTYLLELDSEAILVKYQAYHYLNGRNIILDDVLWEVESITMEGYLCLRDGQTRRVLKSEEISLAHIY